MSAYYELSRLNDLINSFGQGITGSVDRVYQSSSDVNETTIQIFEGLQRFQRDMEKGEEAQLAHEGLMRIDQLLKEQFGDHETIRKTVMGVVRDFDINLVRNSTIQELSEELWITSSRYWLSYALIAITAWVNDYPDVAKNALSEAGHRDAIKTTLFFCLTNLRFGRMSAAKAWFCEYLNVLEPSMLQKETAVMLEAFMHGLFGVDKELEQHVLDLIDEWMRVINEDAQICEELVNQYQLYINNLQAPCGYSFQSLAQFCSNADAIRASALNVSKYDSLIALVRELHVDTVEQTADNYKERVDAVLMDLISKYDAEEQSLKNQQSYYRFMMESMSAGGETNAAQQKARAEAQYQQMLDLQDEHSNIGRHMINWVIFQQEDQDAQVRKFGFQNTKKWFMQAVDRWDTALQQAKPINFSLHIDVWSGVSNGNDYQVQAESLRSYYEANKFRFMFVNTFNIVFLILLVLSAGMAFATLYSLVVTGVSLGLLVFNCIRGAKKFPQRVNAALQNLNACMAEIANFQNYYNAKRSLKQQLASLVEFF